MVIMYHVKIGNKIKKIHSGVPLNAGDYIKFNSKSEQPMIVVITHVMHNVDLNFNELSKTFVYCDVVKVLEKGGRDIEPTDDDWVW